MTEVPCWTRCGADTIALSRMASILETAACLDYPPHMTCSSPPACTGSRPGHTAYSQAGIGAVLGLDWRDGTHRRIA